MGFRLPIVQLTGDLIAQDRQASAKVIGNEIVLTSRTASKATEPYRKQGGRQMFDGPGQFGGRRKTSDPMTARVPNAPFGPRGVERGNGITEFFS